MCVHARQVLQVRQRAFRQRELSRQSCFGARLLERRHDTERDVRRLVVRRIGVRHVVGQARRSRSCAARVGRRRPAGERAPRSGPRSAPTRPTRRSLRRPTSGRRRTASAAPHLPGFGEHGRPVHVGVAVHHAEADELRLLEAGNQAEHARLLAPLDLRLEADQAEVIAGERCPAAAARPRTARGRCADRRGRPASSGRSAACPRRDAPSPRSAGSPRRTAPCRSRARSPIRPWTSAS